MIAVGGFGAVKLVVEIGETTYSAVFEKRNSYCSQPEFEPIGKLKANAAGRMRQVIVGYKLHFKGMFENVKDGDEALIDDLYEVIQQSQMHNTAIKLYPKWNEDVPDSTWYMVKCRGAWELADVSNKVAVAQRIKDMEFVSEGLESSLAYFTEGRYIPVYSTMDGKVIVFGDIAVEILRSWRP